jgi:hypothetical protein
MEDEDYNSYKIITDEGYEIPYYRVQKDHILNRSVVFYGQSETGKSTATKHFLYQIQKDIAWGLFICPTSGNGDFTDCYDRILIKKDITIEKLHDIFKRQELAADVYRRANNLVILEQLFNMVSNNNETSIILRIKQVIKNIVNKIYENNSLKTAEKIKEKKKVEKRGEKDRKNFMKIVIKRNYGYFQKNIESLNEEQKHAIKFINFCPNILLHFDDCASKMKGWLASKKFTTIKDMFYNGRHYFMTQIYSIQDEKELDPLIRKSVFISIFCNDTSANAFFSKTSNSVSKDQAKIATIMSDTIFKTNGFEENHKKMIYGRKLSPKVQYFVADMYEEGSIYIGGTTLRSYCEKVRSKENKIDTKNKFYNNFKV